MLTLLGSKQRYCDGLSRRSFLKIGGLAMGGLALPDLLRAEAQAGVGRSHKAVIMVYLSGGLSHQDTFDLKPDAPEEIRGEFQPIATKLPGVQVGELLPSTAAVMDKIAVIRSIVGLRDEHSSFQNLTGFPMVQSQREGKPHFGAVISKVQGPKDPVVPPFVDLFPTMQHRPYNSAGPGHLGFAASAAKLGGEDMELMRQTAVSPERFDRPPGTARRFRPVPPRGRERRGRRHGRILPPRRSTCWPRTRWRRPWTSSARTPGSATATASARPSTSATAPRCGTTSS